MFYDVMLKDIKDGYIESSVDYNNKVVSIDNRVIIFAHAFIIPLQCFVHIVCM